MLVKRFVSTGGAERCAVEAANGVAAAGHEVTVFAQEWDERVAKNGVRFSRVPQIPGPTWLNSVWFAVATARRRLASFDIVHSLERHPSADLAYVTCVCHRNVFRNRPAWKRLALRLSPRQAAYLWLEAEQFRPAPGRMISAASLMIRRDILENYPKAEKRIPIVYSGVDANYFAPADTQVRADMRLERGVEDQTVILFVGSEFRRKGLDVVLRALGCIRRAHPEERFVLWVAGGGPPDPFREIADEEGIAFSVRFLGLVRDVRSLYQAADLFVLPSRREPCSLAVLEAMACGLPAIISGDSGNAELVQDGHDAGVLKDASDPEELALRIMDLLGADRRREMGLRARRTALGHAWTGVVRTTLELYDEILVSRPPPGAGAA